MADAPPGSFEAPLWRALAVFRVYALAYASILIARNSQRFARPAAGWVAVAAMAAWTAYTIYAYARPAWRRWPLLTADLAVAGACVLVSPWVIGADNLAGGMSTLPIAWFAAPVVAWAIAGGRRRGLLAAALMGAADLSVRGPLQQHNLTGTALMLLAGGAVGHVARLGVDAEDRLHRAVELEAATRERERLARGIHDSVLQVLALVQRRGAELGGEAAELGRLAGEQEAALRALVATAAPPTQDTELVDVPSAGGTDLRAALGRYAVPGVSLAAPAGPVTLPANVVAETAAAVGAALDNVRRHGGPGTRAWLLVEDEPAAVTVTVRDDGPGIAPGRLAGAAADGRLGVAQSIRGRIRDLGGTVTISSGAGGGTEVEIRVPRVGA